VDRHLQGDEFSDISTASQYPFSLEISSNSIPHPGGESLQNFSNNSGSPVQELGGKSNKISA
jgi:hypothetical protein